MFGKWKQQNKTVKVTVLPVTKTPIAINMK